MMRQKPCASLRLQQELAVVRLMMQLTTLNQHPFICCRFEEFAANEGNICPLDIELKWMTEVSSSVYATPLITDLYADGRKDIIVPGDHTARHTAPVFVLETHNPIHSILLQTIMLSSVHRPTALVPRTCSRWVCWRAASLTGFVHYTDVLEGPDGAKALGWPGFHRSTVHSSPLLFDIDMDGIRDVVVTTYDSMRLLGSYCQQPF